MTELLGVLGAPGVGGTCSLGELAALVGGSACQPCATQPRAQQRKSCTDAACARRKGGLSRQEAGAHVFHVGDGRPRRVAKLGVHRQLRPRVLRHVATQLPRRVVLASPRRVRVALEQGLGDGVVVGAAEALALGVLLRDARDRRELAPRRARVLCGSAAADQRCVGRQLRALHKWAAAAQWSAPRQRRSRARPWRGSRPPGCSARRGPGRTASAARPRG